MKLPIYLDYHATTPVDPRVLDAMLPYFTEKFGNPSSSGHSFGWVAEEAVRRAREQVARLLNARPEEVVFTSGATESNNLAIKGAALANGDRGRHVVTVATEHKAVLEPCESLRETGFDVTVLPVENDGLLSMDRFRQAVLPDTILVSVMAANNEIGVLQPLAEIGRITRERGILFHTDAAQAAGKIPIDVEAMNIDLLSISAHKLYGPKGSGCMYVRRNPAARLRPLVEGGGQERGFRSGTLNVPGIVGVGMACEVAGAEMEAEATRLSRLRDLLKSRILGELGDVFLNGHPLLRLPASLSLAFGYVEGEALLMAMRDLAVSSGSACTTTSGDPSHVLRAIGLPSALAKATVRFGLGRFTTEEEVEWAAAKVVESVRRLRESFPLYRLVKSGQIPVPESWRYPG